MTKRDIVRALAKYMDITIARADTIVNYIFSTMKEGLKDDGKISISDFGTLNIVSRKSRKVRDINTKEIIEVPDYKDIKFIISPSLKEYINNEAD